VGIPREDDLPVALHRHAVATVITAADGRDYLPARAEAEVEIPRRGVRAQIGSGEKHEEQAGERFHDRVTKVTRF
jgi:hypothetical protein